MKNNERITLLEQTIERLESKLNTMQSLLSLDADTLNNIIYAIAINEDIDDELKPNDTITRNRHEQQNVLSRQLINLIAKESDKAYKLSPWLEKTLENLSAENKPQPSVPSAKYTEVDKYFVWIKVNGENHAVTLDCKSGILLDGTPDYYTSVQADNLIAKLGGGEKPLEAKKTKVNHG